MRCFIIAGLILFSIKTQAQTNIFPSSGNVGIGTSNPQADLDIYGNSELIRLTYNAGNSGFIRGRKEGANHWYVGAGSGTHNHIALTNYQSGRVDIGTSGLTRVSVDMTGKLGVGTISPLMPIHSHVSSANNSYIRLSNTVNTGLDVGITAAGEAIFWSRQASQPLKFGAADSEVMRIAADGKVGLGTISPDETLEIGQNGGGSKNFIRINSDHNQNVGIKLSTGAADVTKNAIISEGLGSWHRADLHFVVKTTADYSNYVLGADTKMLIDGFNGNVGIGTTSPDYKLDVLGTIRANEVKVETGWSDFVFEPDYDLPTIQEVENFIDENGHLPDIPSAKEVEENGISLGEMDSKLLQKIEELTLYMIRMQQQLDELKAENENLKRQIAN